MKNDGIKLDVNQAMGRLHRQLKLPVKLPWPDDAVMIVAALLGTENRSAMEAVIEAECRHCGADLAADLRTLRTAHNLPERKGRPIKYFCVDCCLLHENESLNLVIDQRDGGHSEHRKVNNVSRCNH